jgi:hypothetical protein
VTRLDEDDVYAQARASARRMGEKLGLTPHGKWPVVQ